MLASQIWVLTVALSLLSFTAKCDEACSMTAPCLEKLGQGQPFAEPDQVSSDSPAWAINMTVDIGEVKYGWLELKRRMYNGKIVGPTWNVKRGDKITVNLRNQLSEQGNDLNGSVNSQNYPNTTNLHTHGLHISSNDPQDNILIRVEPGKTYQYVYEIHEESPAGTNWYHAHVHQSTMFQVQGGLAGMLIIQDEESDMSAELEAVSCPKNCDKDIQMVFQPILQYNNGVRGFGKLQIEIQDASEFRQGRYNTTKNITLSEWMDIHLNYMTTNGILQPILSMTTCQMYRIRMVNAGGDTGLDLYIVKKGTENTSGCQIREIAIDAVYLNAPREMHEGQTLLTPAGRVDWLVKCNEEGDFELKSLRKDKQRASIGNLPEFNEVLVTLSVVGEAVKPSQNFPTALPTRPSFVSDLTRVKESDIGGRFVVELNPDLQLNRESWNVPYHYRYKMEVNKMQEWYLINTDTVQSHPIHIHVNHFQVISYNNYSGGYGAGGIGNWSMYRVEDGTPCYFQRSGHTGELANDTSSPNISEYLKHAERFEKDEGNTLGYSRLGDWGDTLLIPQLANITIRFLPHQFTCDVIIHCHILSHEDGGMMIIADIVNAGESTAANVTSGNAYPGTCDKCDRYPFNNPKTLCDVVGGPPIPHFVIIIVSLVVGVILVILVIWCLIKITKQQKPEEKKLLS